MVNLALETIYSLPITFVAESETLAQETYLQAYNNKITYYDAAFISLAKQFDATLITENIKHQGKTSDVTVILLLFFAMSQFIYTIVAEVFMLLLPVEYMQIYQSRI